MFDYKRVQVTNVKKKTFPATPQKMNSTIDSFDIDS